MSGGVRRGVGRPFLLRRTPSPHQGPVWAVTERITITAAQRDALYDQILARLSGASDLWMLIRTEQFAEADRLGRAISDDLRLILDDLGWGDGGGEEVRLTTPPDVLRRALSRHCHDALHREASEIPERVEARREMDEARERNHQIVRACRRVLAELDLAEGPPGRR